MIMTIILPMAIACVAYVLSGVISSRAVCYFNKSGYRIALCAVLFAVFVACVWWSLRFPSLYDGKFYFSDFLSFLPILFY